jgi:hypothetical protein
MECGVSVPLKGTLGGKRLTSSVADVTFPACSCQAPDRGLGWDVRLPTNMRSDYHENSDCGQGFG